MRRSILPALVLLAVVAPADGAGRDVVNPTAAPLVRTFTCEEIWRIGPDDQDEFILGVVGDAVRSDDGNIYLLDTQTQTAHRFAPDGRYLGVAARSGEGPGELALVYRIRRWDAGQLAFGKVFPAEIIIVGTDGVPVGTVRLQNAASPGDQTFVTLAAFARCDGVLVAMAGESWFDGGKRLNRDFLAVFDDDGAERHRFGEHRSGYDFSHTIHVDEEKDSFPLQRWALGPEGSVYLAPERAAYLVELRGVDGALRHRITRQVAPRRRSQAEKDAVRNGYTFSSNGGEIPDVRYSISDYEPPIKGLAWRDDRLWVERPRERREDGRSERRFDVCDRDGRLLEERRYLLPADEEQDMVEFLGNGLILRVANLRSAQDAAAAGLTVKRGDATVDAGDEDAPLEVILYRAVE